MEKNKIVPMKKMIFLGFVCLASCSYVPERVSVSYEPPTKSTYATQARMQKLPSMRPLMMPSINS